LWIVHNLRQTFLVPIRVCSLKAAASAVTDTASAAKTVCLPLLLIAAAVLNAFSFSNKCLLATNQQQYIVHF
jgi:hypothetical protein